MPKSLGQEILFTILMVFVMVYTMVCYNIALATGGLSNSVFSLAATIIFKTTALNYPMATFWQLFVAGPLVRAIFVTK